MKPSRRPVPGRRGAEPGPGGRGPLKPPNWLTLAAAAIAVLVAALSQVMDRGGGVRPPGGGGNTSAGPITGRPEVIDGDSVRIAGREFRLTGIDAPEGRQTCTRDGREYRCGDESRNALRRLLASGTPSCEAPREDQHGRGLAVCFVAGRNINEAMVSEGWAVAFDRRLERLEAEAKALKRGLWAGEFERPQAWRRRNGIGN